MIKVENLEAGMKILIEGRKKAVEVLTIDKLRQPGPLQDRPHGQGVQRNRTTRRRNRSARSMSDRAEALALARAAAPYFQEQWERVPNPTTRARLDSALRTVRVLEAQ